MLLDGAKFSFIYFTNMRTCTHARMHACSTHHRQNPRAARPTSVDDAQKLPPKTVRLMPLLCSVSCPSCVILPESCRPLMRAHTFGDNLIQIRSSATATSLSIKSPTPNITPNRLCTVAAVQEGGGWRMGEPHVIGRIFCRENQTSGRRQEHRIYVREGGWSDLMDFCK